MNDFTFLTEEQCFGKEKNGKREGQLGIIKTMNASAVLTDYAIILGGEPMRGKRNRLAYPQNHYTVSDSLGMYWTKSVTDDGRVLAVSNKGCRYTEHLIDSKPPFIGGRPALQFSEDDDIYKNGKIRHSAIGDGGIMKIEYGFYPQQAASKNMQKELESEFKNNQLAETGNTYTAVVERISDDKINTKASEVQYSEYEYNGKRYIRAENSPYFQRHQVKLSNGETYNDGDAVWIKVSPVEWLVDKEAKVIVADKILFAGVRFDEQEKDYNEEDFDKTSIKKFMNENFAKDLVQDFERCIEPVAMDYNEIEEKGDESMEPKEDELNEVKTEEVTEVTTGAEEIEDKTDDIETKEYIERIAKGNLTAEEYRSVYNDEEYLNNKKTIKRLTKQLRELTQVDTNRKIIQAQEIKIAELEEQIEEAKNKFTIGKSEDLPESTL